MAKKQKSKEVDIPEEDFLSGIAEKRQALIDEITPKLLTNTQLKQGGGVVRGKYNQEQGFIPVIAEINDLGRKLGIRPIGLGHLRK